MFWSNFIELCNKHNKKPNPVAKELGISSGAVTSWKQGRMPYDTNLKKIADYFGVTVQEILNGPKPVEQKEKPADEGELGEDVIIYNCDGKTVKKKITKEQMSIIRALLDAAPSEEGEEDI